MKIIYQLFVKGIPKAQPRPRMAANGHVYNPNSADAWKEEITAEFCSIRHGQVLIGPVRLTIRFSLPLPKRMEAKAGYFGKEPHIKKPDTDNLLKAVMDAMTTAGVWNDDAQVFEIVVSKHYANKNTQPGAQIIVEA